MTSCDHCEHVRRHIADNGGICRKMFGIHQSDPTVDFPESIRSSIYSCPCRCHDIARWAGKLPKLQEGTPSS